MQRWADVLSNVGHLQRRDCPTAIGPQEGPHTQHDGGQAERAQHVEIDQPGEVQPLGEGQHRGVAQRVAHGLGEGWDEARHRLGCDQPLGSGGHEGCMPHLEKQAVHICTLEVWKRKNNKKTCCCAQQGVSRYINRPTQNII